MRSHDWPLVLQPPCLFHSCGVLIWARRKSDSCHCFPSLCWLSPVRTAVSAVAHPYFLPGILGRLRTET